MTAKPYRHYDGHPPHVKGSDTSRAAALEIEEPLGRLQEMILRFVHSCGKQGATSDEVEEALLLRHQSCSARILELRQDGLLTDSGQRRATRSGRLAAAWIYYRHKA